MVLFQNYLSFTFKLLDKRASIERKISKESISSYFKQSVRKSQKGPTTFSTQQVTHFCEAQKVTKLNLCDISTQKGVGTQFVHVQ